MDLLPLAVLLIATLLLYLAVKAVQHLVVYPHRTLKNEVKTLTEQNNKLKQLESMLTIKDTQLVDLTRKLEVEQKAGLNVLKEIEQERVNLKKFQLAVENASDHILITDSDGIILYTNPAVEAVTGFTPQEVLGTKAGKLWGDLMPKSFYENMWNTIKKQKKTFKGEITNMRKDVQNYYAEISISPILNQNDEVVFFVCTQRDITQKKEIDKMKTEFISLASHQLRTPLAVVRWGIESLANGDYGKLTTEQHEALNDVQKANEKMLALIEEFLSISRIESGKLAFNMQMVNLQDLVKDVVQDLRPNAQEKEQVIELIFNTELPQIKTDPSLITHVYTNIITNALKYSPPKSQVTITLGTDGKVIMAQIHDNGYGIPKAEQARIFEKFYRAKNIKRYEPTGTGLGLYLVKSIIQALGGKIGFESEEDKGTTFWFNLPTSK